MSRPGPLPLPAWVVPPAAAVADLLWLAYGTWQDQGSAAAGGMTVATAWVSGARSAPVTERSELPVARELAEAERTAAQLILDAAAGLPRFPAESECAAIGVTFMPPTSVSPEWARGVEATLRWLLGRRGADGPAPAPIRLPARRADGSLASVDELYERALIATPLPPLAEDRHSMRLQADRDVERSRRLDERIRALQAAAARPS